MSSKKITPRTLIREVLDHNSVSKSAIKGRRRSTRQSLSGSTPSSLSQGGTESPVRRKRSLPTTAPSAKRRSLRRASLADPTPRSLIAGYLASTNPETPAVCVSRKSSSVFEDLTDRDVAIEDYQGRLNRLISPDSDSSSSSHIASQSGSEVRRSRRNRPRADQFSQGLLERQRKNEDEDASSSRMLDSIAEDGLETEGISRNESLSKIASAATQPQKGQRFQEEQERLSPGDDTSQSESESFSTSVVDSFVQQNTLQLLPRNEVILEEQESAVENVSSQDSHSPPEQVTVTRASSGRQTVTDTRSTESLRKSDYLGDAVITEEDASQSDATNLNTEEKADEEVVPGEGLSGGQILDQDVPNEEQDRQEIDYEKKDDSSSDSDAGSRRDRDDGDDHGGDDHRSTPYEGRDPMTVTDNGGDVIGPGHQEEGHANDMDKEGQLSEAQANRSGIMFLSEDVPGRTPLAGRRNLGDIRNYFSPLITPKMPPVYGLKKTPPLKTPALLKKIQNPNQTLKQDQAKERSKVRAPPRPKGVRKAKKRENTLPSSLTKGIFRHFSRGTVSKDAVEAVEDCCEEFFVRISSDLAAYARHAKRQTITFEDVELLLKRQGFVSNRQSLYALIEEHVPMEYRQRIIPSAVAGGKVTLKLW